MDSRNFKKTKEKPVQLVSNFRLRNIFPGEWESIYKGEGIEFADIKPFEPGDDLRAIDPRTLGLNEEMRIVQRIVEKQLKIYVWADFSGSMQRFGEMFFPMKPEIRDVAIGLILFSAVKIYSPIGFYPIGLGEKRFFPPKMGEEYCLEILDWVMDESKQLSFNSSGAETSLSALLRLATPKNMVFFVSDFKQRLFEGDFTNHLRSVVSSFDFIPVIIRDPLEESGRLARAVRLTVRSSSEQGKEKEIYLTPEVLEKMQEVSWRHFSNLEKNFKRIGLECLVLDSPSIDDCEKTLSGFFQSRKRVKR